MNALRLFGLYILFTKLYASVSPHGTRLANSSGRGQPRPTVPAGRGQTGLRSDESRVSPESVLTNSRHGVASGVWSRVRLPVDRLFHEWTFLARECPGSYSRLVYEMARQQQNAAPTGGLRKPIRLAVAQIGEVAPATNLLGELRSHPALIATVVALPSPVESRERYPTRSANAPEPPSVVSRLAELRSLAKAMRADQVLILGGSIDTWTTRNVLAPLDITLVGTAIFPSARVHGQGKAAGILLDVESGAVRFQ